MIENGMDSKTYGLVSREDHARLTRLIALPVPPSALPMKN